MEETIDKLPPGMCDSTIGSEFNVSESTVCIRQVPLNGNTHKTRLCINQLTATTEHDQSL